MTVSRGLSGVLEYSIGSVTTERGGRKGGRLWHYISLVDHTSISYVRK